MANVKHVPQLKIPDQKKNFYADIEEIYFFRSEMRQKYPMPPNYAGIQQLINKQLKVAQENLSKRQTKYEKVTKLQNRIKETDGKFKKKLQETILKDINEMNLTEFISEFANHIVECSIAPHNLKYFVELSLILHSTYKQFIFDLIESIKKHVNEKIDGKQGSYENENSRAMKRRHLIRFICELYTVDLFMDLSKEFIELLKMLLMSPSIYVPDIASGKEKDKDWIDNLILNISTGTTFLKFFSYEIFGTLSYNEKQDLLETPELQIIYKRNALPPLSFKNQIEQFIMDQYIDTIKKCMKYLYKKIEDQRIQTVSEFGEDPRLKELKNNFIKLKDHYKSFCDFLGLYDPNSQQMEDEEEKMFDLTRNDFKESDIEIGDPFEIEQEKLLYQNLPDVKDLQIKKPIEENQAYDEFFKTLKDCINIEIADKLAADFLCINNKKTRRAILEELIQYRTYSSQIAPFQSRVVAIISRGQRDLEEECTKYLVEQFKQVKSTDNFAYDKKQRILRYICELTKFRVIRQDIVLEFVQIFLEDLVGSNIELLVGLIENCGPYLLKSSEAYRKFKFQLEQISKLRVTKPLPQQQDIQLENALDMLNPTSQPPAKRIRPKTQLQKYIRYLLIEKLTPTTFKQVQDEILCLPFKDSQCHQFIYKYIVKLAVKGRFSNLDLGAGLLSVIKKHYPILVGQVVDHLLEEIQLGLEDNAINLRQKRITITKFFGELYNYNIILRQLLFNILYQFLEYKHESDVPKHIQDLVDSPDDTFRIQQCLVLVESVREYHKKLKNYLVRFLVFFQRYVLSKSYIPQTVEFNILDIYDSIEPNLKNIHTLKQAEQICLKFIELEEQKQKIVYEQELKNIVGEFKPAVDNSAIILEMRRKEQEEKEREEERKIQQDFDQQLKQLVSESQSEARFKKIPQQQGGQKKVVQKAVIKVGFKNILQRDTGQGNQYKNQNQKGKKSKDDLMKYANFNQLIK